MGSWRGVCFLLLLRIVFPADTSFSTLRKKQRGPEGAAEFPPWTTAPSGLPPSLHRTREKSSLPAQRPRGGVPLLGVTSVCRCAAPLHGVATLPVLRAPLWLTFHAAAAGARLCMIALFLSKLRLKTAKRLPLELLYTPAAKIPTSNPHLPPTPNLFHRIYTITIVSGIQKRHSISAAPVMGIACRHTSIGKGSRSRISRCTSTPG